MIFLITGPSGTGKSTLGRELEHRGYRVIETDFEPGMSGWFENATGKKLNLPPPSPASQEWLAAHSWLWDRNKFVEIISSAGDTDIFFVGGAYNESSMYDLFDKKFSLFTGNPDIITKRLQGRGEGNRWNDGSPELLKTLEWDTLSQQHAKEVGSILLNSSRPVEVIADEVLGYTQNR